MKNIFQKTAIVFVILNLMLGQTMPVLAQEETPETPTATQTPTETPVTEEATETPTPFEPTPTPTLEASETPTPEEVTPTSTGEATATPEIAAIATETLVMEEQVPQYSLSLSSNPAFLTTGGIVNLNWMIEGELSAETPLRLKVQLPAGFEAKKKSDAENFDPLTGLYTTPVTVMQGSLLVQTNQVISEDSFFSARLLNGEATLAEASFVLPLHERFEIGSNGGQISARDGNLKVKFYQNVFKDHAEGVEVSLGAPTDGALPYSLSGKPFEIKAWVKKDKTELKHFDERVEFEISLADYGFTDAMSSDVILYWYNPETGDWQGMYSWVDSEANTLHGTTDHFSIFDVGPNNWEASKLPTVDAFQVANFTGAGTYSLPIEVPPGPGGLQPNLSLNYNSQIIDEATNNTQASWVGMGWSLETGSIERNTQNNTNSGDDSWMLNVNGIGTEIIRTPTGEYYTADENFMRVTFANNTWTIWDKQGNVYYFEYAISLTDQTGNCDPLTIQSYRWSLTRVKNVFGQQLTYAYTKETKNITYRLMSENNTSCTSTYGQYPTDTASYLSTITYPDGRTRVRFDLEARTDYTAGHATDEIHHSFERQRLNQIIIERDTDGNGSFETVMKVYDLTYSSSSNQIWPNIVFSAGGKVSTLVSVQEWGAAWSTALPLVTFTYGDSMHLTSASNGYGGGVTFEYENWYYYDTANPLTPYLSSRPSYTSHLDRWESPIKLAYGMWPHYRGEVYFPVMPGRAYFISATTTLGVYLRLYDGYGYQSTPLSTTPQAIFILPATASDAQAFYDNPYDPYTDGKNYLKYGNLWGLTTIYRVKTKTISDGNGHSYPYTYTYTGAAVNDAAHSYAVASGSGYSEPYSEFRGHASVTETAPDGTQTITSYHQDDVFRGMAYNIQLKANNKKLTELISTYSYTELQGHYYGGKIIPRYWTKLDSAETRIYNNNGTTYSATKTLNTYESTYGNLLTQTEQSWNGSAWVTYRSQANYYWPNNSSTRYLVSLPGEIKVFNAAGNMLGNTIYLFDGNTGDHQTMPADGKLTAIRTLTQNGSQYSQASFTYDTWGNRLGETTWSGYGVWNTSPTGGARTTATVYDPAYHTYPISTTNPLNQSTIIDHDYTRSVPISETDPNGAVTSATYDAFGRILSLTRAGDSGASLSMSYTDSYPFTTTITLNAMNYSVTRKYDGMGRPTQTNAGGIITDTLYVSPTETWQSLPYASGESVYYTKTVTNPATQTSSVTAPDGRISTTTVNGLTTTATDAKGHSTTSTSDVWGRVILVTPPTGPAVGYTYDTLGNLLTASRGGSTTTLTYDNAGHKKTMTDPDMGFWQYYYDALGNLTSQIDARGCTLTMNYDDLSRLDTRNSSGNCGQQVSVNYDYDQGTNGIGRRTSMNDSSGSTEWNYDDRGRVTKETKVITGSSAYVTEWGYNSADLNTWIKYPDGEIVNNTYNSRMLLEKVDSLSGTYASSILYDSAGRMTHLKRGNNLLDTAFTYNAWTAQGGRLDTLTTTRVSDQVQLQQVDYTYDPAGNITGIFDLLSGETQSFGYDPLDRLTSASATAGLANYSEAYTYNTASGNLETKAGTTLQYTNTAHKHAVTSLSNGNTYRYDANGNQITRHIASRFLAVDYTLFYDAENRLVEVKKNTVSISAENRAVTIATFIYDGDGRRVKSIIGAETSLFVGAHYEITNGTVTKYYFAGASRIAMRTGSTLTYLLSDHLGSTSLTTDASGNLLSEMRYKAWGEVRYSSGKTPTDYTYTGQYSDSYINLLWYGSRHYDPELGRFIQPDSIVPLASQGVQAYDRYGYVNNNPVRYNDPTGHEPHTPGSCYESLNGVCGYISHDNPDKLLKISPKKISKDGIDFIKEWESFEPSPYNDDGDDPNTEGNCTVGYGYLIHFGECNGSTSEEPFAEGITEEEAADLLEKTLLEYEATVVNKVSVELTQNQYDALVSLTYNIGRDSVYGFPGSDLLIKLNNGDYESVPEEMLRWVYPEWAKEGLTQRRKQEGAIFTSGIYP